MPGITTRIVRKPAMLPVSHPLETPPNLERTSAFLNLRVADVHALYELWSGRGAEFLTPPKQHQTEIRCYIRDPDGHLIER